ncbi:hypothetical protein RJ639_024359 [Escallonia herrerae]|uniref:Transposase (putative) gypsy type domain-containing protein n=1 Tax=Escallonia herrerae TaxID=1293975 RepID=A0AA88V082_9ASTE|nr:hypothetical protein RJ639_024359 [Escallonia herrerae]
MFAEDLLELIWEHPLFEGWYACLPSLQEPTNYGMKFESGIYEEQVKSGYRLPLHPFALRFFKHYHMSPGQLVPNGWKRLVGLIYLGELKSNKGWPSRYFFVGRLDKGKLSFDRDWNPYCKDFENPGKPTPNNLTKHILSHIKLRGGLSIDEPLSEQQLEWARIIPQKPVPSEASIPPPPATESVLLGVLYIGEEERKAAKHGVAPAPKKTRTTPPDRSPLIVERVSIDEDPIFRPRWTLRCDDIRMPDTQISEQHLVHGVLPRDKEMYGSGSEMLSRFEMARQIETLERRLEQVKKKAAEEAKEMFTQRFPDISLGDFVMHAMASPSGENVMPSEAGDAAASHPPEEGPSSDAPEP